jgi:putative tricarboxylic transport membrane protein
VKKWQRWSGYLFLSSAAFLIYQSWKISLGPPSQPGPGFLGFFLGLALGVCSIGLIALNRGSAEAGMGLSPQPLWKEKAWRKPLISLASLVGFILLMWLVGAVATMILFFLVWLRGLEKTGWRLAALVAVIGATCFYLIFAVFFQIPLPKGVLFP